MTDSPGRYLSLDLGGTKLLIGEVDSGGRVLRCKRYPSGSLLQREAVELLKSSLDDYIQTVGFPDGVPSAAGLGIIGRVDSERGRWIEIDPVRSEPFELGRILGERLGLPVRIDNDVKAATLAEMTWGEGKSSRNFIYINAGTGIASGIVSEGRLLRGAHFDAGETGHMKVGVNVGTHCVCGREDCVETISSGVGIDICARLLCGKYPSSPLSIPQTGRVDVREVVELSKAGDPLCTVLIENAARGLADLVLNLVRVSDPDVVVLGGGVASNDTVFAKVQGFLDGQSTMRLCSGGVVRSSLDPSLVGLLGAAALAIEAHKAAAASSSVQLSSSSIQSLYPDSVKQSVSSWT